MSLPQREHFNILLLLFSLQISIINSVGMHKYELLHIELFIFITSFLGRKNKRPEGCSFYPKQPESQMSHHMKPTRVKSGDLNEETNPGGHQESSHLPPGCFRSVLGL